MKFKRILSAVLASTMVAGVMCVSAFADATDLPTATVTELTGEELCLGESYENMYLNYGLTFTADETAEQAAASEYANYTADYVISFSKDVNNNDIVLFGNYGQYGWLPCYFQSANDMENENLTTINANTEVKVMKDLMDLTWSYKDIVKTVNEFKCGVVLNSENDDKLDGLKVNLALCIFDNAGNKTVIGDEVTYTYVVGTGLVADKIDADLSGATYNTDAVGYYATAPLQDSYKWTVKVGDKKLSTTVNYGTVSSGEGSAVVGIVITDSNNTYGTDKIEYVTVE